MAAKDLSMRLIGAALVALLVSSCATNPVTGKREVSFMSEAQEIQIGQEMDQQVQQEMGVYDDRELQEYVRGIGLRLAATLIVPTCRGISPWSMRRRSMRLRCRAATSM